eukprot:6605783-Karenia_brevis.AAC.1
MSGRASDHDKGVLRSILAGAFWTWERLARIKVSDSSVCPFCKSGAVEDEVHLWWHCSAWNGIRANHPLAMQAYNPNWPQCLQCCSLMPENLENVEDTLAYITAEDSGAEEESPLFLECTDEDSEWDG